MISYRPGTKRSRILDQASICHLPFALAAFVPVCLYKALFWILIRQPTQSSDGQNLPSDLQCTLLPQCYRFLPILQVVIQHPYLQRTGPFPFVVFDQLPPFPPQLVEHTFTVPAHIVSYPYRTLLSNSGYPSRRHPIFMHNLIIPFSPHRHYIWAYFWL